MPSGKNRENRGKKKRNKIILLLLAGGVRDLSGASEGEALDIFSVHLGKMNRKPGDWNCSSCQHLNFSRRDSCQRCGESKGGGEYGNFSRGGSDVRPGDWYCSAAAGCGAHNFASRSNCFKCGAFKEESGSGAHGGGLGLGGGRGSSPFNAFGPRSGWKSGDWICPRSGCNEHNFASRTECYRCSAPRDATR
eukprot:Gb_39953 [translate_table: standard]